jgi:phenylacetate-CoA ligase
MPPLISYTSQVLRHKRNAKLTREQLESRRLAAFRSLVSYARDRSPYYRAIIKERGLKPETCVPTDFPILTKRELMERFDEIVTDRRITKAGITAFLQRSRDPGELYLDKFVALHTSGSSGEVGYFVYALDDYMRMVAGGYRTLPADVGVPRRIAFFGAAGGHFGGVSASTIPMRQWPWRWMIDAKTFEINAPLAATIDGLNRFCPDLVSGYPSGLKILAEAQIARRLNIKPMLMQAGGEPLSRGDQQALAEVFGCPCTNLYGATEHLVIGVARANDSGMTLFDDTFVLEEADDHVLVTSLLNRTLPLIRYRMSDTVRRMDAPSQYGPFPMIEPVIGRNEWVPTFRNRRGEIDFISPHIINEIFVPGIWRFQMRWGDQTRFRFSVCMNHGLDARERKEALAAITARLHEILLQKELDNVAFTVDAVDDIPVDPKTGKFRLVTQS